MVDQQRNRNQQSLGECVCDRLRRGSVCGVELMGVLNDDSESVVVTDGTASDQRNVGNDLDQEILSLVCYSRSHLIDPKEDTLAVFEHYRVYSYHYLYFR